MKIPYDRTVERKKEKNPTPKTTHTPRLTPQTATYVIKMVITRMSGIKEYSFLG